MYADHRQIEIYDSVGSDVTSPVYSALHTFLCYNGVNKKLFVTSQILSDQSSACGHLAVVALKLRQNGKTFHEINSLFHNTHKKNEKIVKTLFKNL